MDHKNGGYVTHWRPDHKKGGHVTDGRPSPDPPPMPNTHALSIWQPSSQTYTHTHTQHTHMVEHTEKTVCEIISNMHVSKHELAGRHSDKGRGGSHAAEQNTHTRRYTHARTKTCTITTTLYVGKPREVKEDEIIVRYF